MHINGYLSAVPRTRTVMYSPSSLSVRFETSSLSDIDIDIDIDIYGFIQSSIAYNEAGHAWRRQTQARDIVSTNLVSSLHPIPLPAAFITGSVYNLVLAR